MGGPLCLPDPVEADLAGGGVKRLYPAAQNFPRETGIQIYNLRPAAWAHRHQIG